MKIAVVGCGALGSFYGARLWAAAADVHFLLRSDYERVRQEGVRILSPEGDLHARPAAARRSEEIGPCDTVLVALKTTANDQFEKLLPPLVGPATAVVTLQNGLGNEEQLAGVLGAERVLGGLCFVCLNRIAPGVVRHTAHGNVTLGEYGRPAQERTTRLVDWFRRAGIRCDATDQLSRVRWEKLLWNIPFNGLGVAGAAGLEAVRAGELDPALALGPCLTTEDLLGDPRWLALVRELMEEVRVGAQALGFALAREMIEDRIERTRRMGAYKASTLLDFEQNRPLELESMFAEPLRRIRGVGGSAPILAGLTRVLRQLESLKRVAVA